MLDFRRQLVETMVRSLTGVDVAKHNQQLLDDLNAFLSTGLIHYLSRFKIDWGNHAGFNADRGGSKRQEAVSRFAGR